jgi:hypothetical protein
MWNLDRATFSSALARKNPVVGVAPSNIAKILGNKNAVRPPPWLAERLSSTDTNAHEDRKDRKTAGWVTRIGIFARLGELLVPRRLRDRRRATPVRRKITSLQSRSPMTSRRGVIPQRNNDTEHEGCNPSPGFACGTGASVSTS